MKLDLAFESRFVLPYKLCKMIFDDANFAKAFPESRVLCREDSFLALLYRLNKGCEFSTVSDVFGASPDTHSRTFGKYLDACLVFFKKTINIPSKLECEKMKKVLSRNGFPNPQAVFIGMFNFLFTSRQKKSFFIRRLHRLWNSYNRPKLVHAEIKLYFETCCSGVFYCGLKTPDKSKKKLRVLWLLTV